MFVFASLQISGVLDIIKKRKIVSDLEEYISYLKKEDPF